MQDVPGRSFAGSRSFPQVLHSRVPLVTRPLSRFCSLCNPKLGILFLEVQPFVICYSIPMLSRGSSDAGNRLRRAKSTSSTASKHTPLPTQPLDPAVARQYAEAAAATAYGRALGSKETNRLATNRKKSACISKCQGSHLQSSLAASRSPQDGGSPQNHIASRTNPKTPNRSCKPNLVSRAESLIEIEAQLEKKHTAEENYAAEPSSFRRLRKARSLYVASEPNPPTRTIEPANRTPTKDNQGIKNVWKRSKGQQDNSQSTSSAAPAYMHQAQCDAADRELVARARDRIFQQLHTRRLRESTSFMVLSRSFKKRHDDQKETSEQDGIITYDNKGPSPGKEKKSPRPAPRFRDKARVLSAPLTNSFKRFLRKSSSSSEVPAQQREASKLYFEPPKDLHEPSLAQEISSGIQALANSPDIPQISVAPAKKSTPPTTLRAVNQFSDSSDTASSTTRSRVTSWSNSTAANTVGTAISQPLPAIDEHSSIPDPAAFYEPQTSTLSMKNVFKRHGSRSSENSDKKHSNTTQRIYSALMKKIEPGSLANNEVRSTSSNESPDSRTVLGTLPSQKHASKLSRRNRQSRGTIRTVTPDSYAAKARKISTASLAQQASGALLAPPFLRQSTSTQANAVSSTTLDEDSMISKNKGKPSRVGETPWAATVATPTKDLLEQRAERAKNRWKFPLQDSGSPFFSSRPSRLPVGESPYEMRPNHRSIQRQMNEGEVPDDVFNDRLEENHHQNDPERARLARELMSPSIYSRNTEGRSKGPSPASKQSGTETSIVITSRDIQTIPIASEQKSPSPRKMSSQSARDWKAWLTHEIGDLPFPEGEVIVSELDQNPHGLTESEQPKEEWSHNFPNHRREIEEIVSRERTKGDEVIAEKTSHAKKGKFCRLHHPIVTYEDSESDEPKIIADNGTEAESRERLRERTPSRMSERFSMLRSSKPPTDRDVRGAGKSSSRNQACSTPSPTPRSRIPKLSPTSMPEHIPSPIMKVTKSTGALRNSSSLTKDNQAPLGDLRSKAHRHSPLRGVSTASNVPVAQPHRLGTKSTFELRANSPSNSLHRSMVAEKKSQPPSSNFVSSTTPFFCNMGKENAPSPPTPVTKAVSAWASGNHGARISVTPGSEQSIRSRRLRPNHSGASLRSRESDGIGMTPDRVTPLMLDAWLEARQSDGLGKAASVAQLRTSRDGVDGAENYREASYAFL